MVFLPACFLVLLLSARPLTLAEIRSRRSVPPPALIPPEPASRARSDFAKTGSNPVTCGVASCRRKSGFQFSWKCSKTLSGHANMIVLVDNYDSFTFNLFHYLGGLGADVAVHRNDKISTERVMGMDPEAIVLSPGPCTPDDAGICLDLIAKASATVPVLGVCLGHQAIGQAFGGEVVRAPTLVHGKLSEIKHQGDGVFRGINAPFKATRYHSLVVERSSLPSDLAVTAETDDRLIMGLAHRTLAVHGVQFHPESIASEHGHLILRNFLDIAAAWNASTGRRRPGGARTARGGL